ncbi:hypothetical protein [Flavobacterium sp.]|uniref:hypothetical protein n=1 Tax=Flavobacterium sp. TaxID=239 RepID=UPI0039E3DF79
MNKLPHILGNGLWQMMPSVFTLLLSLAVVRLFDASVWGKIVAIVVVQQIVSSIVSWGNKDFLQRQLAQHTAQFSRQFSALLVQRLLLLVAVLPLVYFSGWIPADCFVAFSLLVLGRFAQQSFDILILRDKRFKTAIALELLFLALQLAALVLMRNTTADLSGLLMVFWIPTLCKSLVLCVVFRQDFDFGSFSRPLLPGAFFFALLSLSGLVHSKIDVLLVSRLLDDETLGKYQIIMAFLWNIQSVAMYISGPYVPNFYRLNEVARGNYSVWLRKIGFLVVPLGVTAMLVLLYFAFGIATNASIVLASLLFSMSSFVYLPWILQLNKENRENEVLFINIFGTATLIGLVVSASRWWHLGLEQLLWIVTFQQFLITAVAFAAHKKTRICVPS